MSIFVVIFLVQATVARPGTPVMMRNSNGMFCGNLGLKIKILNKAN